MKKSIIPIFLFMFIILSMNVFSATTYPYLSNDNEFLMGDGFYTDFPSLITSPQVSSSPAIVSDFMPLIEDLDGDGQSEIIVIDSTSIKLYHYSSSPSGALTLIDGQSLTSVGNDIFMTTFDIDGDNQSEIIAGSDNDNIHILHYNGTSLTENTISLGGNKNNGDVMIRCGQVNECVIVYNEYDQSFYNVGADIKITAFNSTALITTYDIQTLPVIASTNRNKQFCLPYNRHIEYKDYDGDGQSEYIFTYAYVSENTLDTRAGYLRWMSFNGSTFTSEGAIARTSSAFYYPTGAFSCDSELFGKRISSPISFDFDGVGSNDMETIFAMNDDSTTEYKLFAYESDYSVLGLTGEFPELFLADGVILSNPVRMNAFTDSGSVDVCVLGYDDIDEEIDLLCASKQRTGTFSLESDEFAFDYTGYENISTDYMSMQNIIHGANFKQSNSNDELISSLGIFEIDFSGTNELLLLYENPSHPSVLLPLDYENVGRDDLISLTDTRLYYIDDAFTNTEAEASKICFNPSNDGTIKLNATFEIKVTTFDYDGDDVSTRAIVYYGEASENASSWTSYSTQGETETFTFTLDTITSGSTIRVETKDAVDPNATNSYEYTFSVGSSGASFGDSSICYDLVTTATDNATTISEAEQQEVIDELTNAILGKDENGVGGISEGYLPIIALIGIILAIFFSVEVGRKELNLDSVHAFFLGIVIGVVCFVGFTWLGWIPLWITIILLLIGSIILAVVFRDSISGRNGGI